MQPPLDDLAGIAWDKGSLVFYVSRLAKYMTW